MIVLIIFRRARISSAIINITAVLILLVIFFFTVNAPSSNPAFYLPERAFIYKDEISAEFYFGFLGKYVKKIKNSVFRLLNEVYFIVPKFFLSLC
jgi:hypothetical protein